MIEHIDHSWRYPVHVQQFDTVTDWYRHCEKNRPYDFHMTRDFSAGDSWAGHSNVIEAVKYCEQNLGESHMRPARELMNKIDASFRDRERISWTPSPHGAYAVVPEYLANEPFNMRQKQKETNDSAPIRYFIECVISAGVGLHELERRAAGIAALIMRTAEERSVELYCVAAFQDAQDDYSSRYGVIACIKIETHPVDLHSAIAAFATREFCRSMAMSNVNAIRKRGGTNNWLYGHPTGAIKSRREDQFRKVLNLDPQDVFMQGGYLTDAHQFDSDPVKWVHAQIEKQRNLDDRS